MQDYCASKFALRGMNEALRMQLLKQGSSVGCTMYSTIPSTFSQLEDPFDGCARSLAASYPCILTCARKNPLRDVIMTHRVSPSYISTGMRTQTSEIPPLLVTKCLRVQIKSQPFTAARTTWPWPCANTKQGGSLHDIVVLCSWWVPWV